MMYLTLDKLHMNCYKSIYNKSSKDTLRSLSLNSGFFKFGISFFIRPRKIYACLCVCVGWRVGEYYVDVGGTCKQDFADIAQ